MAVTGGTLGVLMTTLLLWQVASLPQTLTVRGQVVDGTNGRPIAWADVFLEDITEPETSTAHQFTQADGNGRFELRDVPAGRYQLVVSRSGWLGVERSLVLTPTNGEPPLTVTMVRSSAIAGVVQDAEGHPIGGLEVTASPAELVAPEGFGIPSSGTTAVSDHLGRFRIYGLPPGRYVVGAVDRMRDPLRDIDRFGFQWMPGVPFPELAATVNIESGAVADIALTLAPLPVSEITIQTVRDEDGAPVRAIVQITQLGTSRSTTRSPAPLALQGGGTHVFRIHLRAGLYRFDATGSGLRGQATLRITGAEPTTLVVRLKPRT